jgi:hypothetical protein
LLRSLGHSPDCSLLGYLAVTPAQLDDLLELEGYIDQVRAAVRKLASAPANKGAVDNEDLPLFI